jgi:hypothetical protein
MRGRGRWGNLLDPAFRLFEPLSLAGRLVYFQSSGRLVRGPRAEVAQLVEHTIENRGVGSSILPLGTILQLLSTFRTRTIRTRRTIRTVST